MLANLRSPHGHAALVAVALAAAAVPFAWLAVSLWPFTVDDTFITLRYAHHLAAGLGPTWNPAGPPAEGYTTPLWVVLLAIPHALRVDPVAAAKVLSLVAGCGVIAATSRLAQRAARACDPGTSRMPTAAALLLCAALPAAAVHAVSGMETALFTLLLTLLVSQAAQALEPGARPQPRALALLALLCGLARPEGNIAAGAALGVFAWQLDRPQRRALIAACLALWIVPGAIYFAWRWSYYQQLLPLPFYVKVADAAPLAGLPRVLDFLRLMAFPAGAAMLPACLPLPRVLRPAIAAALALLLLYTIPQHVMGYFHRYLMPLAPIGIALAIAGLVRSARWLRARNPGADRSGPLLVGAASVVIAAVWFMDAPRTIENRRAYARGHRDAHQALGAQLARIPDLSIALSDAGAIPYVSDARTLDLVGLNDAHIARTHDRSPAYVLSQHPDAIIFASRRADAIEPLVWNRWEAPLATAVAERGWEVVMRYRFLDDYWLWLVIDPAGPRASALRALGTTPAASP